jgi:hypothetical protein
MSDLFYKHGFKYESSSRIDQVYNPNKSKKRHYDRINFWKYTTLTSLRRMLFGVES